MILEFFQSSTNKEIKAKREGLYRLAYAWSNDPMIADDLVNETMYKALKSQAQLRDKKKLDSWLYKILANSWYDYLRQKRPTEDIENIVLSDSQSPEKQLHQHQIIHQVRVGIASLPQGQRQVLTLVDLEGVSYQEVSEILDIPIGTVMSRLNRARAQLKKQLLSQPVEINNTPINEKAVAIRRVK